MDPSQGAGADPGQDPNTNLVTSGRTEDPRGFGEDAAPGEEQDSATGSSPLAGPDQPASDEEQAMYNLVVSRAIKFMYGQGKNQVLKVMGAAETPAKGVAQAAVMIIRRMVDSAQQQNQQISEDVLYNAGVEIVENLMNLGVHFGVFQFKDDKEAAQQQDEALGWALNYYGNDALQRGEIDQQGAMQQFQQGLASEQQQAAMNPVSAGVQQAMRGQGSPAAQGGGIIRQTMQENQ